VGTGDHRLINHQFHFSLSLNPFTLFLKLSHQLPALMLVLTTGNASLHADFFLSFFFIAASFDFLLRCRAILQIAFWQIENLPYLFIHKFYAAEACSFETPWPCFKPAVKSFPCSNICA